MKAVLVATSSLSPGWRMPVVVLQLLLLPLLFLLLSMLWCALLKAATLWR